MGLVREFREFALKGNMIDLAVGVIIGAAFGGIVKSLVEDMIMPPIGKLVGNLDFSNLYFSLSDKIDAANAAKAKAIAATQPAAEGLAAAASEVLAVFDTGSRLTLAEAKALGPVVAYGNFITVFINFLIVALCIFVVIKLMNTARKRFEKEQAAAAPPAPPADIALLTEIRDILKSK